MSQTVIWTCLPNGIVNENGKQFFRVSAYLSFRLTSNPPGAQTKLEDFNHIEKWAKEIVRKKQKFHVLFNGNQLIKADLIKGRIVPGAWETVFKKDTPVRSYEFQDYTNKNIHSYPIDHLNQFIVDRYLETALENPHQLPTTWDLIPLVKEIADYDLDQLEENLLSQPLNFSPGGFDRPTVTARIPEEWELIKGIRERLDRLKKSVSKDDSVIRRIKAEISGNKFIPYKPKADPKKDFGQLFEFYEPKLNKQRITKIPIPDFDFHDILSILNDYPALMRALGIVLDFKLPFENVPNLGTVEFVSNLPTANLYPKTNYTLTPEFRTKENSTALMENGWLKINSNRFTISQIDIEGGAFKIKKMADQIAQSLLIGGEIRVTEDLPALRTTGITVSSNGFAQYLFNRFTRHTSVDADKFNTNNYAFNAEDVLTGYRLDIFDEKAGQWFSLYRRRGEYNVNGVPLKDVEFTIDEGFTQASVTEDTPDIVEPDGSKKGGTNELYASENQFAWHGWSLAVPIPGKSVDPDDSIPPDEEVKYQTPQAFNFKLNSRFSVVPGTLPKLRFGNKYRVKIRTVDLAGNSINLTINPNNQNAVAKLQYDRYEPVLSPTTILGNTVKDGESAEEIVIRSNGNQNLPTYLQGDGPTLRYFVPPEVGQKLAEKHAVFDDGIGIGKNSLPTYQLISDHDHDPQEVDPNSLNAQNIKIDFLPDPAADGIVIWHGHPKKLLAKVPFYPGNYNWPDPLPITLTIEFSNGNFELDQSQIANSMLIFRMPPGTMEDIFISSYFSDTTLTFMGLWNRMETKPPIKIQLTAVPDQTKSFYKSYVSLMAKNRFTFKKLDHPKPTNLKKYILDGGHWMFTPSRDFRLVHAVQQPVKDPQLSQIKSQRESGSISSDLIFKLKVHGNSTEKVDIMSAWRDPIDDLSKDEPEWVDKSEVVDEIKFNYEDTEKEIGVVNQNNIQPYQFRPRHMEHLFNDTKHHRVEYHLVGTTRYREYFFNLIAENEQNNTDFPLTRESSKVKVRIKSSARPITPQIENIIPLMPWRKNDQQFEMQHRREGGALRIYIKRPWFSSGVGELLGVLCINPNSLPKPNAMMAINQDFSTIATQWGSDPINIPGKKLAAYPLAANFKRHEAKKEGIQVEESGNVKLDVVGYPVAYDYEKKMWFADVYINPPKNQYFPFIRFALCRFQPDSLGVGDKVDRLGTVMKYDLHISKIVKPEFIQVLPQKTCTVNFDASKQNFVIKLNGAVSKKGFTENESSFNHVEINIEDKLDAPYDTPVYVINPALNFWRFYEQNEVNQGIGQFLHTMVLPPEYANKQFRIVVKEWEWHYTDKDVNQGMSVTTGAYSFSFAPRLVFADTFEIE
ncbi:MAG: hypothetical protein AAF502_01845 [Bacteroidota bacterium]